MLVGIVLRTESATEKIENFVNLFVECGAFWNFTEDGPGVSEGNSDHFDVVTVVFVVVLYCLFVGFGVDFITENKIGRLFLAKFHFFYLLFWFFEVSGGFIKN